MSFLWPDGLTANSTTSALAVLEEKPSPKKPQGCPCAASEDTQCSRLSHIRDLRLHRMHLSFSETVASPLLLIY